MPAKSLQSRTTLCNPIDCSTRHRPPGSSVHGILQARRLEWVAISFSWESAVDLRSQQKETLSLINMIYKS